MTASQPVSLSLRGATLMPPTGPYSGLLLDTSEGTIEARLYQPTTQLETPTAIVWLGDDAGGFDSPADGLYDRLAERFQALGVASLRVQYRNPADHAASGLDALVSTFLLTQQGFGRIVVVGHGQGALGAVQAGLSFPAVAAVAVMAPDATALEGIEGLAPKPLLIMHGTADAVTPTQVARDMLARAAEPKRIYYYQGADHQLTQAADVVTDELSDWLKEQLGLGR
ncbi:Alpha/beta hydrolase family protein [compost metagenome]